MAARDEAGRAWTGVPQGQSADEESADEESADEKMGPALPASHGPRTWDGGQVPCEGRPDTRWGGQAPSREPRGRSRFRPADCIRTEEITLDTVNLIQGGRCPEPAGSGSRQPGWPAGLGRAGSGLRPRGPQSRA